MSILYKILYIDCMLSVLELQNFARTRNAQIQGTCFVSMIFVFIFTASFQSPEGGRLIEFRLHQYIHHKKERFGPRELLNLIQLFVRKCRCQIIIVVYKFQAPYVKAISYKRFPSILFLLLTKRLRALRAWDKKEMGLEPDNQLRYQTFSQDGITSYKLIPFKFFFFIQHL